MAATLKDIVYLFRRALLKFSADGCSRMGAALAYYTLFSLFPLLLLLISILGFLLASGMPLLADARTYILDSVAATLPQATDMVAQGIKAAERARGATGVVGLLTLLWSASNMFTQLCQALNIIWDSPPPATIGAAIRTKLTAIAVVLSISALLFLSMVADTALSVAARHLALGSIWRSGWARLAPLYTAAMATAVLALLYRYLPNTTVRWRHVWPGALLAGVAWELLREGFTVYATRYANYVAVYGTVGTTIALLSWIYLSAQILLFGAEFTVVYKRFCACGGRVGEVMPLDLRRARRQLRKSWRQARGWAATWGGLRAHLGKALARLRGGRAEWAQGRPEDAGRDEEAASFGVDR